MNKQDYANLLTLLRKGVFQLNLDETKEVSRLTDLLKGLSMPEVAEKVEPTE